MFNRKNSGNSNTVTRQNGKTTTNELTWNAETSNDTTKVLYELTTNGVPKYAEVSLPTTQLNALTNGRGLAQMDGALHSRLLKDYSIELSDPPFSSKTGIKSGNHLGGSTRAVRFNSAARANPNGKHKKFRTTPRRPRRHHKTETKQVRATRKRRAITSTSSRKRKHAKTRTKPRKK
jgi:hypothetical protein